MRIEKIIDINDEPFSATSTGKRKVKVLYNGPRYIYLEVDELSTVQAVMHSSENMPESHIASQKLTPIPGREVIELDADKTTIAACHFWNSYTLEVEDYSETLPNGKIYSFEYSDQPLIGEIWDFNRMKWNSSKKDFDTYKFLECPVSQQQILESCDLIQSKVQIAVVENGTLTADQRSSLNDYIIQVNQFKADVNSGIKHWKLPFPVCDIPY